MFFFVVILFSQFWFYLLPAQNEYSIENSSLFDPVEKLWSTQRNTLEPEEWHASWIWQKGENEGGNLILLAKKDILQMNLLTTQWIG